MSSQDKMTHYTNFSPHQRFILQDQQPRPSNKQKLKILKTNNYNNSDLNSNCPRQETEITSTPTRPVENVVITSKGLQDRNNLLLDGRTVENKGKLILSLSVLTFLMRSATSQLSRNPIALIRLVDPVADLIPIINCGSAAISCLVVRGSPFKH